MVEEGLACTYVALSRQRWVSLAESGVWAVDPRRELRSKPRCNVAREQLLPKWEGRAAATGRRGDGERARRDRGSAAATGHSPVRARQASGGGRTARKKELTGQRQRRRGSSEQTDQARGTQVKRLTSELTTVMLAAPDRAGTPSTAILRFSARWRPSGRRLSAWSAIMLQGGSSIRRTI